MAGRRRSEEKGVPLCVDLDGTLIRTDMLVRSVTALMRSTPFRCLLIPFWLLNGKAYLKRQLAMRMEFDPATLPYNQALLDMLRKAKDTGRYVLLATASDVIIGKKIADYLALFDEVLGSDGIRNLRGSAKARILEEQFGLKGFDYAGNAEADLPVWEKCREAIVVGKKGRLAGKAAKMGVIVRELEG